MRPQPKAPDDKSHPGVCRGSPESVPSPRIFPLFYPRRPGLAFAELCSTVPLEQAPPTLCPPRPQALCPRAGLQPSPAHFQALSSGITGAVWPVSLWSEPLSRPPRKQPGSTPRQQLQGTGQQGAQMDTGKREALLPGQPHPPRAREGGPHRCHWPAGRAGGRPCPPPMEQPDMLPVCRGCPTPSARPSVSQGLAKSFRRRLCNSRRGKQMREKKEWGREDKKN